MVANWFTLTTLAGLVRAGVATAHRKVVKGTETPKVERYFITESAGGRSKADRCHKGDQRVTYRSLHQLRHRAGLSPTIGTHGDPRYPIDLGAPICPMDPEGRRGDGDILPSHPWAADPPTAPICPRDP
jgi:hypothetical protein